MELNLNLDTNEKEEDTNPKNNSIKNDIINNQENDLNRNMFEFITVIGKGGFGKVWKVQYKKTKEYFALKEMSKRKILDKKSEKSINSERKFLSILNHPFIVNMHYAFQDNDNLYLVMDMLSGGDLRYHCSRYRTFSEEQTRFFIACIIYSLEYIHFNNVIHRDIKPENLVLDDKGYVRVTDFGIAKYNTADNSSETSGTPGYMSPEVMNAENHSFPADFFAIGVIGYEFLMGYRPYNGKNRKEIKEKIFSEKVIITPEQKQKGWSDDVIDFINKLLERNKNLRLGCNKGALELKEHEWLKYYPWEELEQKILPAPFIPEPIDNFDKSYCQSEEKITEETKIRYKKIYSSDAYQSAFMDFYFNKDNKKFIRKQRKSLEVKEIKNKEEKNDSSLNDSFNNNNNNNDNIKDKEEKNNNEEILSLVSVEVKDKSIDNNINEKSEKEINSIQKDIKSLDQIKNENEIIGNSNEINVNNTKEEKTEEDISIRKIKINSEGNHQKILKNNNIGNINSTNSINKQKEIHKYVNQYNTNNIIQINNFKKIIINHDDYIKKNKNDDFFLKEYIKYHNNKKQKKLSNKYNYILKVKKGNKYQPRKNSSLIFNSSKKDNNYIYNSEFIINNQFPKKEEQIQINTKNKTIFKHFMQNNNNNISRGNISNNLIVKNTNTIKYQKLRLKKRYNNSFRVNHIKNLYKGEKINTIKKIYLDHNRERNDNMSNRLEKNNFGRTYIYPKMSENYNTKLRKEIKSNDKKIPKIPIYMNNNMNNNNNISSSNYYTGDISDNFDTNRLNNISNFKLNANNDINFKYSNSLNNISYKNKTFNFNRKVPKIKSLEKNKLFNTNIFNNKSRTNSNIKLKNFDRINSAGKFKSVGYKFDKVNGLNNNIKKTRIEKQGNKSNSNKKDKFQYFSLS